MVEIEVHLLLVISKFRFPSAPFLVLAETFGWSPLLELPMMTVRDIFSLTHARLKSDVTPRFTV